jgi:Arc/MetJ-type ribon-helix-helix transcriptional regulator
MKSLTVQLPDELAARIEAEAVERKMSISDVIRKHLNLAHPHNPRRALFEAITDVVRLAVAEPLPHAERSPDRALFDAITDVVRSAEQLIDAERLAHSDPSPESERLAHSDPLTGGERSPNPDPLSDAARSPDADPLPDADALPDEPGTRKKAASRRAKRSESAP